MESKIVLLIVFYFLSGLAASAQAEIIGRVADRISGSHLQGVRLGFERKTEYVFTDQGGYFRIDNLPQKSAVLSLELKGYKKLIGEPA